MSDRVRAALARLVEACDDENARDFTPLWEEARAALAETELQRVKLADADEKRKWIEKVGPTWLHEGRGCQEAEAEIRTLRADIAVRQEEKEITLHIQNEYSAMLRAMARRAAKWRHKARQHMREMLRAKDAIRRIGEAAGEPSLLRFALPGTPEYPERIAAVVLGLRSRVATNDADVAELERLRAENAELQRNVPKERG